MIAIKNETDIKHLRRAGKILADVLNEVIKKVKPGVKTIELDELAEKLILEAGCAPAFKNYSSNPVALKFPTTLCTSVNEEVVHAPASERILKAGDIIGIDIGLEYKVDKKSYFTDMAKTAPVGQVDRIAEKLIKIAEKSLEAGIEQVGPGKYIIDISRAIQNCAEAHGFSIVRELVGHGVGFAVHEEPKIPNYVDFNLKPVKLRPGMVLAIEPMINVGSWKIKTLGDGWTIVTIDGSLSAHFEHTVAVTAKGYEILTK